MSDPFYPDEPPEKPTSPTRPRRHTQVMRALAEFEDGGIFVAQELKEARVLPSMPQTPNPFSRLGRRLRNAIGAMVLLMAFGTFGYLIISGGKWEVFDCLYMTVLSVTTVGYSEVIPISTTPFGRSFTLLIMIMSLGINAYFVSAVTAFFLSEEFEGLWWRRNMERKLNKLHDHIIVCGGGETGVHVITELRNAGRKVVLIDDDPSRSRGLNEVLGTFPVVIGDATEEMTLQKAGIDRAFGLAAVLSSDKDNLFVTITARRMNPSLKIVSRGIEINALDKIVRAGADRVVSPNHIGGVRIATEMVRPHVVQFMDLITHTNDLDLQLEQIDLPRRAPLVGKRLRETDLRQKNLLVLAVRSVNDKGWIYNPTPDYVFEPQSTMIVLGTSAAVQMLSSEMEHYG